MKIMDDFCNEWKPSHAYHKINIFAMGKDEWGALVNPQRMHCTYRGMSKGTSQAEVAPKNQAHSLSYC